MADTRADAYQKRLAGLFAQSAASVTVTRGGVDHTSSCFYEPMDNNTANLYFDGNEEVGLVRPALMLWLQASAEVLVGDVFTYDILTRPGGDLYTVRKLYYFRQGTTPLVLLALCD
jgi:hypothetical protein